MDQVLRFTSYHRVVNHNKWSACWLFGRLVTVFVPSDEPVVIGLDDTVERRWGSQNKKRGI